MVATELDGVPRGLRIALRLILARFVRSAKAGRFGPPARERLAGPASNSALVPSAPNCRTLWFESGGDAIQKKKATAMGGFFLLCGVPTGIRTPVIAVKGRCPRPLDDGDKTSRKLEGSRLGQPGMTSSSIGGGKRDRTADLLHAMQALSQLSYTPDRVEHYISRRPPAPAGGPRRALPFADPGS